MRDDTLLERSLRNRASRNLNILSLAGMTALLIMFAGAKAAFDPPLEPEQKTEQKTEQAPQTKPEPPPPPPAAKEKPPASPIGDEAASKEKETERFVPSQKTSADNSATFPVDI